MGESSRPRPPDRDAAPGSWPHGVTPIGIEDLDRLGLNQRNQLFWNGKQVEVRNRLDLSGLQKLLAVIVSVFAVLGGLGGFVTGLNNASIFLCGRNIHWLGCAAPPEPLPSHRPDR